MAKESVDTKAHHGSGADDFISQLSHLRDAEKSAEKTVEGAREEAARISAEGRERAVEISAQAAEKAVQAKNEIISKSRAQTDAEISDILSDAKKQAERIRAKRLSDREVSSLASSLL